MTAEAVMKDERETAVQQTAAPPSLDTIRAARDGDHEAFDEIMLATQHRVALLAWRILGDVEDVKEAVQETYLRLFRNIARYDGQHDFHGWLYRIAVNVCRDHDARRRRLRIFTSIEEAVLPWRESRLETELDARRETALLEGALDSLPAKERLAIVLRDIEELPTDEVASLLGSSPATVRVQISKARAKLRKWLREWKGAAR